MMKALERFVVGMAMFGTASCATTPPQTPTVNVTGNWVGEWVCDRPEQGSGVAVLKLAQSGDQVNGTARVTGGAINRTTDDFHAVVSGDQFILREWPDVKGSLTVAGDRMSGPISGVLCGGKIAMTREPWSGTAQTSSLVTASATVAAVDVPTRMLTLRGANGDLTTFQVSERVKNLPQVSVGDVVTVAYYESWALQLDQPGQAPGTIMSQTVTAAAGQMPAAHSVRQSSIQATVTAIDGGKPSVTFRGPTGTVKEVIVTKDPRILGQLKVGETYNVTYTEYFAVAVEKAPKP
jgi:hypothetical protein